MNVAIITARAGSKSIINKNVYEVNGKPLVAYPIQACLDSKKIEKIYISTDGEAIASVGREYGCGIIERPDYLGGDSVNHGDVIKHAVGYVDELENDVENIVLLLGNTVMIDGGIIDHCLEILDKDESLDSCMTVWEAQDDHPLRAMSINDEGILEPYGDKSRNVSTERQSYPKAYYYDQGVWAFRKYTVQSKDGVSPWWWMGKRSQPIIRTWVTGRDIHTPFDLGITEWWLNNIVEVNRRIEQSPWDF
ncbi:MAG: acylneuraminate cytidylyltransferase family protein [Bacteroidota bacterium]